MPKVYIIHDTGVYNFTSAGDFGTPVVLFRKRFPQYNEDEAKSWVEHARKELHLFNSDVDYLLLVGDPVSMAVVFHIIASKNGIVKCLRWDKATQRYFPITVTTIGGN